MIFNIVERCLFSKYFLEKHIMSEKQLNGQIAIVTGGSVGYGLGIAQDHLVQCTGKPFVKVFRQTSINIGVECMFHSFPL